MHTLISTHHENLLLTTKQPRPFHEKLKPLFIVDVYSHNGEVPINFDVAWFIIGLVKVTHRLSLNLLITNPKAPS